MSEAGEGGPPRPLDAGGSGSVQAAPGAAAVDSPKPLGPLKKAGDSLRLALRLTFWTLTLGFICAALEGLAAGFQSSVAQSVRGALRAMPMAANLASLAAYWLIQQLLGFAVLGLAALLLGLPIAAGVCAGAFAGLLPMLLISMQLTMGDADPQADGSRKLLLVLLVNACAAAVTGGLACYAAKRFASRGRKPKPS